MNIQMTIAAICLAICAVCAPAHAQTAELERALTAYIDDQDIDGAVFYANINGKELQIAVGTIDESQTTPTTSETRFYIASTGKMMTAAAILSSVEEGKLRLDAPIWPHIKAIEGITALANADKVTLRQLLNHTSGLVEYLGDEFDDASKMEPTKCCTAAEALPFAFDLEPAFPPGTAFEYTNTNYILLGHILAQIDGSLSASLKSHIFDKAGMRKSTVGADQNDGSLAHGFDEFGENVTAQARASVMGDGPVISTAQDVGKFMLALLQNKTLIGPDTLIEMLSGSAHEQSYGLGIGYETDRIGEWFGHAGSYDGYEADVRYYPKSKAAFVILMNGNPYSEETFLDQAVEILF